MYAIVEISGKQYKLEKDAVVNVDAFEAEENSSVKFDKVLMAVDGEKVLVGKPYLANVKVTAKVLGEEKGKKVCGMKFRNRKNYQRQKNGRPLYLKLKIEELAIA
ncbi:MAG: 50S ribosomal protein L21 [Spirochaetota bacterium]